MDQALHHFFGWFGLPSIWFFKYFSIVLQYIIKLVFK